MSKTLVSWIGFDVALSDKISRVFPHRRGARASQLSIPGTNGMQGCAARKEARADITSPQGAGQGADNGGGVEPATRIANTYILFDTS